MQEQSSPVHRHSSSIDKIKSPRPSNDDDDSLDLDLESSARARFSLDLEDPLDPSTFPHTHPRFFHGPLVRRLLINSFFILLWYFFSLLLSLYNKWMFAPAHLNFPFPLFVTSLHMVMQFLLSGLTLWIFPKFRTKREDFLSIRDYAYPLFSFELTDQVQNWTLWDCYRSGYWTI